MPERAHYRERQRQRHSAPGKDRELPVPTLARRPPPGRTTQQQRPGDEAGRHFEVMQEDVDQVVVVEVYSIPHVEYRIAHSASNERRLAGAVVEERAHPGHPVLGVRQRRERLTFQLQTLAEVDVEPIVDGRL